MPVNLVLVDIADNDAYNATVVDSGRTINIDENLPDGLKLAELRGFNTGPGATTLPIKIYSQVRLGLSPEINAASTILIGLVTLGVISATLISKRSVLRSRRNAH